MKKIYIGIDPDNDKSGVAYYEKNTKDLQLYNMTFFELLEYLKHLKRFEVEGYSLLVRVECGYLNKSNWHVKQTDNAKKAAKIGSHTGANSEVQKKICEMCEYVGIPYEKVRPTRRKLNSEQFKQITGYPKRSNQEQRDAAMLVFGL